MRLIDADEYRIMQLRQQKEVVWNMNFVKISDTEIINLDYVATIRKGYSEGYDCYVIYLNTVGEDNVVLQFKTKQAMEEKWESLHLLVKQRETQDKK